MTALFAVTYRYVTDKDALAVHRPAHKDFLGQLHEAGRLRVSGPVEDGARALLIFDGESAEDVAALLDGDPFMQNGLIAERTIERWNVFYGAVVFE